MSRQQKNYPVLAITDLQNLPPEYPEDLLPEICRKLRVAGVKVVILDDDPTGTQTVQGLPVLTHWSEQALQQELENDFPAFFILTNSRSMPEVDAVAVGSVIGRRLQSAAEKTGVKTVVISRSDSTLRGHFPAEVDAVAEAMGKGGRPYILIPFFLEGGRYTFNDIHYVKDGEKLIPAANTPFAKDAAFGFVSSNLLDWVEEKTGGKIPAGEVVSLTLTDIRQGGHQKLVEKLAQVRNGSACIVNAVSYRDMEVVVSALIEAEKRGCEFLYRTAASFVRTRVGMDPGGGLLSKKELVADTPHGGLFIIGSYVEKTGKQVKALFARTDVVQVTVDVPELLDPDHRENEVRRVIQRASTLLENGQDVAVVTSRDLVTGHDAASSLVIGRTVSDCLIRIVQGITIQPRYLVAKGGITSSDVATKGLEVKRAMVLGQALPGVPAWKLGEESRYPGMTYIIFPGNVGDDDALVQIQKNLSC